MNNIQVPLFFLIMLGPFIGLEFITVGVALCGISYAFGCVINEVK